MKRIIQNLILLLVVGAVFTSCSKDKSEPEVLSPANAKGIIISWDTNEIEVDKTNLWINEYTIHTSLGYDDKINLEVYSNQALPYYPLNSIDIVYELLSEDYGTEINENTDLSNFIPNPARLIQYIKNNRTKYKYIARRYGDYMLFNRISNVNYY